MHILSNTPLREVPKDYAPEKATHKWFDIPTGLDKGKRLYYYDYSNHPNPQKTVLFVHGNPECSYTYRHIRDEIIKVKKPVRIIANDHIGFGLSDQASYEMVEIHHAHNLKLLIEQLQLTNIILVIHDWGGPIGIGAFIDSPELLAGMVVLNSTVFPMPKSGYTYSNFPFRVLPWAITPTIIPTSLWGGVAAYVVSNGHPQGFFTFLWGAAKRMLWHARHSFDIQDPEYVWSQMLRSSMNAKSSKRQVRQTPVWGHGYTYHDPTIGKVSNKDFYRHIQHTLAEKWGKEGNPILIAGFFGMWDACGKQEVIQQWGEALPQINAHLYQFEEIGHFIEEYKGVEIGRLIGDFLEDVKNESYN